MTRALHHNTCAVEKSIEIRKHTLIDPQTTRNCVYLLSFLLLEVRSAVVLHGAGNHPDGERVRSGLYESYKGDEEAMGEVASGPVNDANETNSRLDEVFGARSKDGASANPRHVRADETRHYALDNKALFRVFHL